MNPGLMNPGLTRALLKREMGDSWLLLLVLLALAGGALGHAVASGGALQLVTSDFRQAPGGIDSLQSMALWLLARTLPIPVAISAALLVIDRLSTDCASPWLATLAAGGGSRRRYLVSVVGAVVLAHVGFHLALSTGFLTGAAWPAGPGNSLPSQPAHAAALGRETAHGIIGVVALITSATLYGAACVALMRTRGPATTLAIAAVVLPVAMVAWLQARHASLPDSTIRLISLPIPPFDWTSSASSLLHHSAYSLPILALLAWSAPRWIARNG